MANSWTNNLMNIDTAGFFTDEELVLNYIQVVASGDTWRALIKDAEGNVIIDAKSDVSNVRDGFYPLNGQSVKGLTADTLTDIAMVIVGVKKA